MSNCFYCKRKILFHERVDSPKPTNEGPNKCLECRDAEIAELRAKIEVAVKALEFYSNDDGKRATYALQTLRQSKEMGEE